jgi:hypothetical protein
MKIARIFTALFCLTIIFLNSCSKHDSQETNTWQSTTYYLADSLKPYMFKEGSYWVYENDSTHILDSVSVISTERSFFLQTIAHEGANQVEYYKINLHDFRDTVNYYDYLSNSTIRKNSGGENCLGQPVFYLVSAFSHCCCCGLYYLDAFSSLNINGNTFNDVKQFKIKVAEQCGSNFINDTYYYYKDGIGVVRKQFDDGNGNIDTWSLKRWHVIL